MFRPPLGDRVAVALDGILEPKAGAAEVGTPGVDGQPVVEAGGQDVAHVHLRGRRFDALLAQPGVAPVESTQVLDAGRFEPHEVRRVMGDSLRVGLREADGDLDLEAEPVDGETLRMHVERLAERVLRRGPAAVLTGAGISTESGIPDFRSQTGIWAQYDPTEYATIDAFRADPRKVWSFYSLRLRVLLDAEPNAGHVALAELERAGHVSAVVTQNIDGLHQRAGSRDVVEVHGSIRSSTCPGCGTSYALQELLALLENVDAPICHRCGEIVKPDVVMFGELLPEAAIDRAYELARATGLLLVVGSTLEVWPISMLPDETVASGGDVAIVNRGPTSFDDRAALRIEGGAGETLAALAAAVGR
jgi:NAD-dependent deacetylase